jgi:hypothetical protein
MCFKKMKPIVPKNAEYCLHKCYAMMYRWIWAASCLLLLAACQGRQQAGEAAAAAPGAQEIVDAAIARHGGERYADSQIEFRFRERDYRAWRQGWRWHYTRSYTDTAGHHLRDLLSSGGLIREIDGQPVSLSAKDSSAYANSVNSVLYFALLPYFLNDEAVIKEYDRAVEIKGQPYHRLRVSFREEGGGKDYDDEYLYWFHRDSLTLDYLAYSYHTDGGGQRFREAFNPRTVNGIRFADYRNYKPQAKGARLEQLDSLFQQGELEQLSLIENENIRVQHPAPPAAD